MINSNFTPNHNTCVSIYAISSAIIGAQISISASDFGESIDGKEINSPILLWVMMSLWWPFLFAFSVVWHVGRFITAPIRHNTKTCR